MSPRYTAFLIPCIAVFALLVGAPAVAASSWTVTDAYVYPNYTAKGAHAIVTGQAVNENGEVVSPRLCDRQNDYINMLYSYDDDQVNVPLIHAGPPTGWYFNASLTVNTSDGDLKVLANGVCQGSDAGGNAVKNVSFNPDGDFNVELVTALKYGFWEEEEERVYWNVTEPVKFGEAFVDEANFSYRLFRPNHSVVASGEVDSWGSGMERGSQSYYADITFPRGAGLYILSAVALNASYSTTNPYGGTAVPVWVKPTYLKGTGNISVPRNRCQLESVPKCEKGATIEVSFTEEYAQATRVPVTVETAAGFDTYDRFNLTRWNETYWNGTFTIPEQFDTGEYGRVLTFEITGTHEFERDGEQEVVTAETTESVNVSTFKVVESTPDFVKLGDTIDITFGAVTRYSENPVPVDMIDEARVTVRNDTGYVVHRALLEQPFGDAYRDSNKVFVDSFTVPFNTTTGPHTVAVTVTDIFGASAQTSFPFKILDADATGEPVVLVAAGGVNRRNISQNMSTVGTRTENILLRNLGSDTALAEVSFSGDMTQIAEHTGEDVVSMSSGQQHMFPIELDIKESGTYTGNITFHISGSKITAYNITVPVRIQVRCEHRFDMFCITSTQLDREITQPGEHALTFKVHNEGSFRESFDIRPQVGPGNLTDLTGSNRLEETVGAGNTTTARVPFTVETYDSGEYSGEILLSTFSDSVSLNASITVQINKGSIDLSVSPTKLGTRVVGESVTLTFTLENTGTQSFDTMRVTSHDLHIQEDITTVFPPKETLTRNYTATIPSGNTANITVNTDKGASSTAQIQFNAYENYSQQIATLQQDVNDLKNRLASASGDTDTISQDIEELEVLLQQSKNNWDRGYYDAAQRKVKEAEGDLRSIEQRVGDLETGSSSSSGTGAGDGQSRNPLSPFILPMATVLILLVIGGVILYLSLVPEEEA